MVKYTRTQSVTGDIQITKQKHGTAYKCIIKYVIFIASGSFKRYTGSKKNIMPVGY